MSFLRVLAASMLAAAPLVAGSARAATAVNGSVHQQAGVTLGPGPQLTNTQAASWGGAFHDLSASASVAKTAGTDHVAVQTALSAHWDSADAGSVALRGAGWTVAAGDPAVSVLETSLFSGFNGPDDWSYTFTATADGAFDLSADLTATGGNPVGLGLWDIVVSEDGGPRSFAQLLGGYSGAPGEITGGFSQALVAGHTYTVSLLDFDGFRINGDTTQASTAASESGRFDWSITSATAAIPEPRTWALAIAGLALAGAALRRRSTEGGIPRRA